MSIETTAVSAIIKLLRGDDVAVQLDAINRRLAQQSHAFLLDGTSALDDALHQSDPIDTQRLVETGLEYFRQGASRNELPCASVCVECVAYCYFAMDRPTDGHRWLDRAWDEAFAGHSAVRKAGRLSLREEFVTEFGFKWMRDELLLAGKPYVTDLVSNPKETTRWSTMLALEIQLRRLSAFLPQRELPAFSFPSQAVQFVWRRSQGRKGSWVPGYLTAAGELR